jgi:hypothetical protein
MLECALVLLRFSDDSIGFYIVLLGRRSATILCLCIYTQYCTSSLTFTNTKSIIASLRFLSRAVYPFSRIMSNNNSLGYPLLECKSPVPSDIQVSQDIVKDVGLLSIQDLAKQ